LAFRASQPHPGAAAVLGDELDAGRFKGTLNGSDISAHWLALLQLKRNDGAKPDAGILRELRLAPLEQAAGGATLGGCNHLEI
jgi:hypothetical protein